MNVKKSNLSKIVKLKKKIFFKIRSVPFKTGFRRFYFFLKARPWLDIIILALSFSFATLLFFYLKKNRFENFNAFQSLTNLLTINAIFFTILLTYLFSRITWSKERKLKIYKEAINISQKFTEFRKILNEITSYYKVWNDDNATISLLGHGQFSTIDFYDYKLTLISDYKASNEDLIYELRAHEDFKEGPSTLFLAMHSLVKNRKNTRFEYQNELYSEFQLNGLYNIKYIEKCMECDIFHSIAYWLDQDGHYINYNALRSPKMISKSLQRIKKGYKNQPITNKLIKNIAENFDSHYLKELHLRLMELKKGITDLNLILIFMISISLSFGVLMPFLLLQIKSCDPWFLYLGGLITSINVGNIVYFIFRFPFLIRKELKWI